MSKSERNSPREPPDSCPAVYQLQWIPFLDQSQEKNGSTAEVYSLPIGQSGCVQEMALATESGTSMRRMHHTQDGLQPKGKRNTGSSYRFDKNQLQKKPGYYHRLSGNLLWHLLGSLGTILVPLTRQVKDVTLADTHFRRTLQICCLPHTVLSIL